MAAKKKTRAPARRAAPKKKKGPATKRRAPLKATLAAKAKRASRAKKPRPKLLRPVIENPEALALAQGIAAVAREKKADDVIIIDVRARGEAVGYDYVVVASGDSDRQLEAIEDALRERFAPQGRRATSVEASADWVLVNFDDVVAHFFTPDKRSMYDLEGLWSDAPRVEVRA